jgi:hypothetical protein
MTIQPNTELVDGDLTCSIQRDEPHDTHVFVTVYSADGQRSEEHVINADGRCCDGDCS